MLLVQKLRINSTLIADLQNIIFPGFWSQNTDLVPQFWNIGTTFSDDGTSHLKSMYKLEKLFLQVQGAPS